MIAIIVDDEKNGAEALKLLLEQNCPGMKIIDVVYSAESGIDSIRNNEPDIVFLDIEMPTGTGFDVINSTLDKNYEVVFTTAYSQYAIKAFKTHAIDYLLKPIDIDELVSAVEKVKKRFLEKKKNNELNSLVGKMVIPNKKISVPTVEGIIFITVEDIIHLESDSNYTNIFLKDGKKVLVSKTLKSFESQLVNCNFLRVHSAHLINLSEVEKYIKGDGGTLILKNKASIPVSRANKTLLMEKLGLN